MPLSLKFYTQFFHFSLFALLIIICYSDTLQHSWHFDDKTNITDNENIRITSLDWKEVKETFQITDATNFSRPVALFSFALNFYLSGLDTTSYHIVNISIHIICALFVYLVFLYTLDLFRKEEVLSGSHISNMDIALLGTVLWAMHPIQTQAVTYIVQREASMAAMFFMIAMYCYLRFRQVSGGFPKWVLLCLALLFWFLGVGTKENAAMLPVVLFGYEVAFYRMSLLKNKRLFTSLIILFIGVSVCVIILMLGSISTYFDYSFIGRPFTMWERLITQPRILSWYLFLLISPLADYLSLESDIVASTGFFSPPYTILAIFFISSLTAFSVIFLKRFPVLCFSLFYYFVNHIIESSFLDLELYFEHRNYLPSMFLYFALAYYFVQACLYYKKIRRPLMHGLFASAMTIILISEGNATYLRNDVWQTELTLLKDIIKKAPENIRPIVTLGVEYNEMDQFVKGYECFKRAEDLYKKYPDRYQDNWVANIYYNAGIYYFLKKNNHDKAIQLLLKSVEFNRGQWETHVNLGYLYFENEDLASAEKAYFNAVQLAPKKVSIYNMYGRVLYAQGRFDLAIEILNAGLQIEKIWPLQLNLVAAYLKKDDMGMAQSVFSRIPYSPDVSSYLLYRALLFPGEERKRSLGKVAELLANGKVDYCSWVAEVKENKSLQVVFLEDFERIEDELRQAYQEQIDVVSQNIQEIRRKANNCGVIDPESITVDTD